MLSNIVRLHALITGTLLSLELLVLVLLPLLNELIVHVLLVVMLLTISVHHVMWVTTVVVV